MKQRLTIAATIALVCTGCAMLITSESAAEPILGSDNLAIPSGAKQPKLEVAQALARFKAGDYDGALRLLNEAVKKDADLPPAGLILAQLYAQANMSKEAKTTLERVVAEDPTDPEAYMLLANVAMRERDYAKAESLYRKADGLVAAFQKSAKRKKLMRPWIYGGLAATAEARKDWTESQKSLETWLKLEPKNPAAMRRIAYCLFQQKNVDGALEKLREAAVADAGSIAPEVILAQYYERSGDHENAEKWMAAAVAAAPKDFGTRMAVGQWALDAKQYELARKHAKAAMQIAPRSSEARFFRGMIALLEKEPVAAEPYLEAAVKQSPGNFPFCNNLVLALIGQEDDSKNRRALELAEANVKQYPKSADAAVTYGWVLYKLGRLDDAEKALGGASSIVHTDVDAAYVAARVAVDRGRKAEAKAMLESALKDAKPFVFRQDAEELWEQLKK